MSSNESVQQSSNNTLRRSLVAGGAVALLGLGLTACDSKDSSYKITGKDIAAAKAVAARYTCSILSLHDTGRHPNDYPEMGPLNIVNVKVQLGNRATAVPFLGKEGEPKDSHVKVEFSPIVTGKITGPIGSNDENFLYDNNSSITYRPSRPDHTGLLRGRPYVIPHQAGTVADIYLKTHVGLVEDPTADEGQSYDVYGEIPCGTARYDARGRLELKQAVSHQVPEVTVVTNHGS